MAKRFAADRTPNSTPDPMPETDALVAQIDEFMCEIYQTRVGRLKAQLRSQHALLSAYETQLETETDLRKRLHHAREIDQIRNQLQNIIAELRKLAQG